MYLNQVFELSMTLDSEKIGKLLDKAKAGIDCLSFDENNEFVDHCLTSKGFTFVYRNSQYKKKVKLIIRPDLISDGDKSDLGKLIRKLDKRIDDYFDSGFGLNDFSLSGIVLSTDIDVKNRENADSYIKVLQRVGKVKGFSQSSGSWIDKSISLCLEGNSNGTQFTIYDLESFLKGCLAEADSNRKQLKAIVKKSEGLIRAEVRLAKPKAIRAYTDETDTTGQIIDLSKKNERLFLDTFARIVPFGDFYKKAEAAEIIGNRVSDVRLRRRCLRLLELVPEKRSLLLAQKALNCRKIDEVMEAFVDIEVSPVTISKRHGVGKLDNLYKYL